MTVAAATDPWGPKTTPSGAPYGHSHQTACKEEFSKAYAYAIAAVARCAISEPRTDNECVDFTIRQNVPHRQYNNALLEVQIKCTSRDILKSDGVHYPMDVAHYDALRTTKFIAPKIFVVLVVPPDPADWLTHIAQGSDPAMVLKHSAYWTYLAGSPPTTNANTVSVLLPIANEFTVTQLLEMLKRVGDGGTP